MSMHNKIYSYNYKNNSILIDNQYNNNYVNQITSYDSHLTYRNNNILLNQNRNQVNRTYENKNSTKTSINKDNNNYIKLIKSNINPNICTCKSYQTGSRNNILNNTPRQNYFSNIHNNNRNNSCIEKNNFNTHYNLQNINNLTLRNKSQNVYRNHSMVFISNLSNPQYENISINTYSNHAKIKSNINKDVPKINLNNINNKINLVVDFK